MSVLLLCPSCRDQNEEETRLGSTPRRPWGRRITTCHTDSEGKGYYYQSTPTSLRPVADEAASLPSVNAPRPLPSPRYNHLVTVLSSVALSTALSLRLLYLPTATRSPSFSLLCRPTPPSIFFPGLASRQHCRRNIPLPDVSLPLANRRRPSLALTRPLPSSPSLFFASACPIRSLVCGACSTARPACPISVLVHQKGEDSSATVHVDRNISTIPPSPATPTAARPDLAETRTVFTLQPNPPPSHYHNN